MELLKRWAGILSAYFSAQTFTQLAGIGAGLIFVNFMSVPEFALYTLGSSVVGFFGFASDLGSSSSLFYFFQKSRLAGEPASFPAYYAAVLSLRRLSFLVGALVVGAAFPLSALGQGFALPETLLVTGAVLLAVRLQIDASLRLLALRLHDRYGPSYRAEMAGGAIRLLLALALFAAGLLYAGPAVLVGAAGAGVVARLASRSGIALGTVASDLAPYRRAVLRYLLPTLPGALYYSIQGPLVVWLAASFGSARNIAEVGALGRLGLVVGMFSGLVGVVFLPRLARTADERTYRLRYLQYGCFLALIAASLVLAAMLAPGAFLMLLGPHYAGLYRELLLVVTAAALSLLGGYAVAVNNARSWTRWQGAAVFTLVVSQALLAATLPLATTSGVLLFNAVSAAVGLLAQLVITAVAFVRPGLVHWS